MKSTKNQQTKQFGRRVQYDTKKKKNEEKSGFEPLLTETNHYMCLNLKSILTQTSAQHSMHIHTIFTESKSSSSNETNPKIEN